ncbi:MAG: molybdopterin biosynthesis protein MoeB [Candidatus Methanofastidiosum methylothiophilum]|uniref:Molybdopterin biosynthesis protein MoeB n=1 Tax=Candidatus Methanofastidiosum methylothiophilum TaxID=1705564 RepID=A0A150IQB3_9EURY|nr:MAG: molybdopterin biosynthesis protein MoeB [Candidatus Methanofastidiosum methylthiophilus]KYC46834.1 MAG: molybdopterin biosynthesis protein MoeB [Candidatus Methanofastidiosum methylthiophilus]KYC48925.1 MAG: molybdopterin biosynthesis protein MoeB [Candidatus Methanofastidiosum methylthiophilus]
MKKEIIYIIVLLALSFSFVPGIMAQSKVAVVANSIDIGMNPEFISNLKKNNITVDYFGAKDSGYEKYDYVIVLGGPDSTEHTGPISAKILLEFDQDKIRAGGSRIIYEANDTFKSKQKVFVLAGSNRNFTKMTVDQYTSKIISKINGQPIQTNTFISISASQVKQIIESKEDIYLIDVRTEALYAQGHIPGAVNMPLEKISFMTSQIPKNKKIVLYCGNGIKAAEGAQFLADLNYKNVHAMSEGYPVYANLSK